MTNSTVEIHTVGVQLLEWLVVDNTTLVLYAYNSMYRCEETNKTCMHMYKYNSMYRCGKTNKTCMHMYNRIHVHVWRNKQNLYAHVKQYVHVMCGETKLVKLKVVCTYMYNSIYRCGETKLVCTCTTVCTVHGNKSAHVQQYVQVWGNKTCLHLYISVQVWGDGCT